MPTDHGTHKDDPVLTALARAAIARREYLRQIGYLVPDTRSPQRQKADADAAQAERNASAWISHREDDEGTTAAGEAIGESALDKDWRTMHRGHRATDAEGQEYLIHPIGEARPESCAECWLTANDPDHVARRLA